MANGIDAARRPRRTQAERRATTRAALLDATIDSLIESGYAGVTSAEIAMRANVTRGAQAHHFANKAELVVEAVRHLTERLVGDLVADLERVSPGRHAAGRVLDGLWAIHRSPAFAAAIELWSAARTDPELRVSLQALESDVTAALAAAARQAFPQLARSRTRAHLMSTTLATMRGLALLSFVHDDIDREWSAARGNLLQLWNSYIESPS